GVLDSNATDGAAELDELTIAAHLRQVLEGFFRPEFLDRLDETVLFASFGALELEAIASPGLRRHAQQLSARLGVKLRWGAEVPGQLVRDATRRRADPAARGLNRRLEDVFQLLLSALDDAERRGERLQSIRVAVRHGRLTVARHDG